MKNTSETTWSYLAGIIDGEGCISISSRIQEGEKLTRKHKKRSDSHSYKMFSLRVNILNTNMDLMKWLITNIGGVYYAKPRQDNKHKIAYEWRTKGRTNTHEVLLHILPYMVIKKGQVENALEYINMTISGERNPEKREKLYLSNKELNRKGNRPTTDTQDPPSGMIQPDLVSDYQSALAETLVA